VPRMPREVWRIAERWDRLVCNLYLRPGEQNLAVMPPIAFFLLASMEVSPLRKELRWWNLTADSWQTRPR